jgi:hypothetical protein
MGDKADWKGVGDSLKSFADKLSAHADEGTEQVKAAAGEASTTTDKAKVGAKAAVTKFDETTKDPEVGAALKDTTNKFLDALKVTLTGGDQPPVTPTDEDTGEESPKPIEPPQA